MDRAYSFTPMQGYVAYVCSSFVVAIWLNRLVLWCLLPTVFFLTKKVMGSLQGKRDIIDSSWLVDVVAVVWKLQRFMKKFKCEVLKTPDKTNSENIPTKTIGDKIFSPGNTVAKQSEVLLTYVVRDFVSSWVHPITEHRVCVNSFRETLGTLQNRIYERLGTIDKYSTLQLYVELFQRHLIDFQEAQKLIKIQPNVRFKRDREKEFKTLKSVGDAFSCRNIYHKALHSNETELAHLQKTLQILFSVMLHPNLYNCFPCVELVSSIISSSVLLPFMELLSQPYFLHIAIIKLTSDDDVLALVERTNSFERTNIETVQPVVIPNLQSNDMADDEHNNNMSAHNIRVSNSLSDSLQDIGLNSTQNDQDAFLESGIDDCPLFHLDSDTSSVDNLSAVSSINDDSNDFVEEVEEAEDACLGLDISQEIPEKLFISADITQSVNMKQGSGVYTLYTIEYDCWREVDDIWHRQTSVAKRRYREFVTLHERFEDHPLLKKYLKGISGPAKWLRLPFRNTGETTIAKRKIELQKYLKSIIGITQLSNSMAVREFLAYTGDSSIAFVRKPSDLYLFDQVVVNTMKKVSNVFGKLGSSESRLPPRRPTTTQSWPNISGSIDTWPIDDDALQLLTVADQALPDDIMHKMVNVICEFDQQMAATDSADDVSMDMQFFDVLENSFAPKRTNNGKERSDLDKQTPLAASLLDLALQTVENRDCWVRNDTVVVLFKVLLAKFLEVFVCREIDDASTPDRCTYYLELITETLWPNGVLDTTSMTPSEEEKQQIRQQARQCLYDFFPGFLPLILGPDTFDHSVDQVMESLDHPKINKHFAYCLLDVMVEQLFPEITSSHVQQHLLSSDYLHMKQETVDKQSE